MTKKYRLKKDLPIFKVGDIFYISSKGNLLKRGRCISDCIIAYDASMLNRFPNILTDWFEEIKEESVITGQYKTDKGLIYIPHFYKVSGVEAGTIEAEWSDVASDIGWSFQTKEECDRYIKRQKAKQILLRDAKGFTPSKNDSYEHFEVYYTKVGGLDVCSDIGLDDGIHFETHEDAEASIKAHKKEWKTYLGVEE